MKQPIAVTDDVVIPEAELNWRFSRASGPGGQHVNTTDSRVELSVNIATCTAFTAQQRERALERLAPRLSEGVLTVVAASFRSQWRNRQDATERMADTLRKAIAPPGPARRATKPSKRAKRKRLDAKKRRGQVKKLRQRPID